MRVQAKIQKWGNSLGLRLSGLMKSIPHFTENMIVSVEVTEEGIEVRPVRKRKSKKTPFTEDQLLKGLNPETAHSEALAVLSSKESGN